jgi:Cytosine/adenosine deaminases
MEEALRLAQEAADAGEVPVGAVITDGQGQLLAARGNEMRGLKDATAHAELLAIRDAMAATGRDRLEQCDLYVTLEPCTMCAGAIAHARLRRVYYAAEDVKGGAVDNGVRFFDQPSCHHKVEAVGGLYQIRAEKLLKDFFAAKR